jgi:hypothetical protein
MKAEQWSGLITKASPYIIPPGAATEQVNLSSAIPGQLTTRGGMRRVAGTGEIRNTIDCFAFDFAGESMILAMTVSGSLIAIYSPAYGEEVALPNEPVFGIQTGQNGATYTNRFVQGPASETVPPPPETSEYRDQIGGGGASTSSWEGTVTGGSTVGAGVTANYNGGISSTPEFNPTILTLP